MTRQRNFKRSIRARAEKTGESYSVARRQLLLSRPEGLCLAVAQTCLRGDPGDADGLRAAGGEVRALMAEARGAGARVVHFPEGALCWPDKRVLSSLGPDRVGPADWTRARWEILREELAAIADQARRLRLFAVIGAAHPLGDGIRPHNSLYVLSDTGTVRTRYDERLLSRTKLDMLYTPGSEAIAFEVDGYRLGCALGMEAHFSEIFAAYEAQGVDAVLFSTSGESPRHAPPFAAAVQGLACSQALWVSYAAHAEQSLLVPAGIAAPDGHWAARCSRDGFPSVATATLTRDPAALARAWRRAVRAGVHAGHHQADALRSQDRQSL